MKRGKSNAVNCSSFYLLCSSAPKIFSRNARSAAEKGICGAVTGSARASLTMFRMRPATFWSPRVMASPRAFQRRPKSSAAGEAGSPAAASCFNSVDQLEKCRDLALLVEILAGRERLDFLRPEILVLMGHQCGMKVGRTGEFGCHGSLLGEVGEIVDGKNLTGVSLACAACTSASARD